MNGYNLFVKEHKNLHKDHPKKSFGEISTMIAKKWATLSAAEKAKFTARAKQMGGKRKSRSVGRRSATPKRRTASPKRKSRSTSRSDKGKRRSASPALKLFVAMKRKEPGFGKSTTMKEFKQIWKDLPAGERDLFKARAAARKSASKPKTAKKARKTSSKPKTATKRKTSSKPKAAKKGRKAPSKGKK